MWERRVARPPSQRIRRTAAAPTTASSPSRGPEHTGQSEQAPATPGSGLLEQRQQATVPSTIAGTSALQSRTSGPTQPRGDPRAGWCRRRRSRTAATLTAPVRPGPRATASSITDANKTGGHRLRQPPTPALTKSGQEQRRQHPAGQPEDQRHRQAEPGRGTPIQVSGCRASNQRWLTKTASKSPEPAAQAGTTQPPTRAAPGRGPSATARPAWVPRPPGHRR